jgi:cytochrome P450
VFSSTIAKDLYVGAFGESINAMDPPEHTRYRALFQQAFLPRPLKVWGTEVIPAVVDGIVGKFKNRGTAELVSEFTVRFPFEIIYAQLGLPDQELAIFHRLSTGLMCTLIDYEHAHEASLKMGTYLSGLLEAARSRGDGLHYDARKRRGRWRALARRDHDLFFTTADECGRRYHVSRHR